MAKPSPKISNCFLQVSMPTQLSKGFPRFPKAFHSRKDSIRRRSKCSEDICRLATYLQRDIVNHDERPRPTYCCPQHHHLCLGRKRRKCRRGIRKHHPHLVLSVHPSSRPRPFDYARASARLGGLLKDQRKVISKPTLEEVEDQELLAASRHEQNGLGAPALMPDCTPWAHTTTGSGVAPCCHKWP